MAKLRIGKDVFQRAKERSTLTNDEKSFLEKLLTDAGKGGISINVHDYPVAFLRALLDDSRLSPNQRAVVSMQLHGMCKRNVNYDEVYGTAVNTPVEFGSSFLMLGSKSPNCEMFLNGRWYPVVLNVQFCQDEGFMSKTVFLSGTISMCEFSYHISRCVWPDLFMDEDGNKIEKSVEDVLHHFGFRKLRTEPAEFNLKLVRAERAAREQGKVVLVSGPVVATSRWNWLTSFESRALGTPEQPRKAIVEAELEINEDQRNYYSPYGQSREGVSRLPFVRVFSLDTKGYVYVDVDDVDAYEFDTEAMSRLHLPNEMLHILTKVFNTPVEGLFGDLIKGKHGGVVILACGKPGVGKTLTAEVYAEQTQRPLYVLELGELGTNVAQVEENLNRVFTRVARWNAVLQFDECEIFLTKRGDDLERSAIVGSFLRLLDYYRGILFLTTNRADVLDHAVLSRVMLRLDYPNLDQNARAVIWRTMLQSAEMTLTEGSIEELAETDINGRQIRNLTRLARIMYPEGVVTLQQMRGVLGYSCV